MVSSSVLCICAQRLGRKLCPSCKVPIEDPPEEKLREIGFVDADFEEGFELFQATPEGCRQCNGGYRGRFPVLETMSMSQRLRRMVVEGRSKDELKAQKDSLFMQGAEVLEDALKNNPDNQSILTQLKNIYGAMGDNENFMRIKKLLGE